MGSKVIRSLRAWRETQGLTFEQAAALVTVEGEKPINKSTWHSWENGRRIPAEAYMNKLCEVTGVEPNDFYPGARRRADQPKTATAPAQLALV